MSVLLTTEPVLYVWEGASDLALRAERAMESTNVAVLRVEPTTRLDPATHSTRHAIALVSVSVMAGGAFSHHDWLIEHAIPVIWVASERRQYDPRFYPAMYSYTLSPGFTGAELRGLVSRLGGLVSQGPATSARGGTPLIAVSPEMKTLLAEVELYAGSDVSVLLYGETGVGKERIAQMLHERSQRAGAPFVPVNCGAVPEGLFEAHFFGHAKGAFTGSVAAHKGYFEQADQGTLFLDEIGDLPLDQQVKLLRVLEQRSVTRLGSTQSVPVDFRLVAASNRNLRQLVARGRFRADLFYRIAVAELMIPNLDQRGAEEKKAIFRALLQQGVATDLVDIPAWVLESVANKTFHGNVRELANLAERISVMVARLGAWESVSLRRELERASLPLSAHLFSEAPDDWEATSPDDDVPDPVWSEVEQQERTRIIQILDEQGWRRQDTASVLGISRKVLWEKMRKFRITDGGYPRRG